MDIVAEETNEHAPSQMEPAPKPDPTDGHLLEGAADPATKAGDQDLRADAKPGTLDEQPESNASRDDTAMPAIIESTDMIEPGDVSMEFVSDQAKGNAPSQEDAELLLKLNPTNEIVLETAVDPAAGSQSQFYQQEQGGKEEGIVLDDRPDSNVTENDNATLVENVDSNGAEAPPLIDVTMEIEPERAEESVPPQAGSGLKSSPDDLSLTTAAELPFYSSSLTPVSASPAPAEQADDVPLLHSQPPRPVGCPGYESLSLSERVQYCTDVLHPEAVIQLLGWRAGILNATSTPVVNESAEQEQYDLCCQLLSQKAEDDWVQAVISMRESRRRMGTGGGGGAKIQTGGTRTRPKFKQ
ncbi:hypothetical protein BOTBODRAFT_490063 [Botryobasidium botryosum FD-172 SS1]|uniref:Uncharacterized protein n=1 Tax=Botryobasidium botryosum (strain FD-172 SS1) TaxID=930990 RepID=A0A067M449_BOTB1|nr:hypothetical protein BOTBODRAFT_490063 [Botryobasidium botryosum FD-172 SS1]